MARDFVECGARGPGRASTRRTRGVSLSSLALASRPWELCTASAPVERLLRIRRTAADCED